MSMISMSDSRKSNGIRIDTVGFVIVGLIWLLLGLEWTSPAKGQEHPEKGAIGVLLMAHGGSAEWNQEVLRSAHSADLGVPVVPAFGMASPEAIQAALDSLDALGVTHTAVVRLFVSGESFLPQTEFLLGLSDEAPNFWPHLVHDMSRGDGSSGGRRPSPEMMQEMMAQLEDAMEAFEAFPLSHDMTIATHSEGLMGTPEASTIFVGRARDLSKVPESEAVLLLAHGMGDDDENERVLDQMREGERIIAAAGFAEVEVATLREDWPDKRAKAREQIRGFVAAQAEQGRRVIVIPYRLFGFGPYADVLDGLPYLAGDGLLPHDEVGRWIHRQVGHVICESGWDHEVGVVECP